MGIRVAPPETPTVAAPAPAVAAPAPRVLAAPAPRPVSRSVRRTPAPSKPEVPELPQPDPLDPLEQIMHPRTLVRDMLENPRDPDTSYAGPGSGAIPVLDAADFRAAEGVGRDMGAVNAQGEYDPEQADPTEKVLPAMVDQKMRDKATGLLRDKSLRDVFSHGDSTKWVQTRQQQLLNNRFSGAGPKDEAERVKANDEAYWRAVDELATLATVGYTGGPVPLPLDARPDSSLWGNLMGKKVELLGKDQKGNLVLRTQNDLGWAVDVLSVPQNLFSATGIPEAGIQAVFGRKPGAPVPEISLDLNNDYAHDVLAERRSFSDMARDADPQSALAKGVLYTSTLAGDILFPDLLLVGGKALKVPAKGAELLAKTERGARAVEGARAATLGLRSAVGAVGKGDVVAHLDDLARAEEDAARALDEVVPPRERRVSEDSVTEVAGDLGADLVEEASTAERAARYADEVERATAGTRKVSAPLAREVERRTMAAISEAAAQGGELDLRLVERAVMDGGREVRTVPELVRRLGEVAAETTVPAERAALSRLLDAVHTARVRAIASVRTGLEAGAEGVDKARGATTMLASSMLPADRPSALRSLAEAVGLRGDAGAKAVEKAARAGTLVLDAEDVAGLTSQIQKQVGEAGIRSPAVLDAIPKVGKPVTVQDLARLDEAVSKARRVARVGTSVAETTWRAVKPELLGARHATWLADRLALPLRGADEAKPFLDAGLSRAVREATIRARRGVDAAVADASKLRTEAQAADYLAGAPVRAKSGQNLVTSGQSHISLFVNALRLRLADAAAVREAAYSFVRDADLSALQRSKSAKLDELSNWLLHQLAAGKDWSDAGAVAKLVSGLREETARVVGSASEEGWRRLAAVVAAHGQQLPVAEELLGAGVVLTGRDRQALLDTMGASRGMGHLPSAAERALAEGDIARLEAAEAVIAQARENYEAVVAKWGRPVFTRIHRVKAAEKIAEAQRIVDRAEVLRKLEASTVAPSARRTTSLADAERAADVSSRVRPRRPDEDLVRYVDDAPPTVVGRVAGADAERMRRVTRLVQGEGYVPAYVREQLAESLSRASARRGAPESALLGLYKRGVTRGIWLASPRYNLFNFFGDAEQTFLAHGAAVAAKNTVRSALQQAMSLPVVGQALAITGRSEAARSALSAAGDLLVSPGKVGQVLSTMKRTGSLRAAMQEASKISEVNRVLEGTDEVFRLGDRMVSGKQLRDAAVRGGVLDSQAAALVAEETERGVKILDEAAKLSSLPGRASEVVKESVQDVVEGIGERQRVGLFVSLVERGADPEEAAEGVVRALYDYKYSLSEGERTGLMRWLLPWWAWQKNAYRQMTDTLLSPMGAYKVKVMTTAPDSVAEWASWFGEERDVDPLGVRVGAMDEGHREAYHRLVQYLTDAGLDPEEMRVALYEVAPLGSESGGIASWPGVDQQLLDDYDAVAPYLVPPPGAVDVRSYEQSRPMVRARPSDDEVRALWESPNARVADYYAYLLPPSMAESYFNWAGAYAGMVSAALGGAVDTAREGSLPGGKNVLTMASQQVDPMRVPLAGLVLSTLAGKKVVVPVSSLLGQGLAAIDAADVLPAKNRAGALLTTERDEDVAERGRAPVKYAITNPMLALAYQSMLQPVASLDAWERDVEAAMRDPSWRTALKLGIGLPSADIEPAGTPTSESYQVGEGMNVLPTARQPVGAAPAARAPSTDQSYAGER